jgi:hypothetical protein
MIVSFINAVFEIDESSVELRSCSDAYRMAGGDYGPLISRGIGWMP